MTPTKANVSKALDGNPPINAPRIAARFIGVDAKGKLGIGAVRC